MKSQDSAYSSFIFLILIFTLAVILLGTYTRSTGAGLGCPDWPNCYGQMIVPDEKNKLVQMQENYPQQPLVVTKAKTEMAHRYLAGFLGFLILILIFWSVLRQKTPQQTPIIPWLLFGTVILQSIFGSLTVTWKLMPIIVTAHLLIGMFIAVCLWRLYLKNKIYHGLSTYHLKQLQPWVGLGIFLLSIQIFLGAWTSTNYAALVCPHFPYCQGTLFPTYHWREAFNIFQPLGFNYEGGHLSFQSRVTIQMAHRYGALIISFYFLFFSIVVLSARKYQFIHSQALTIIFLIIGQFVLGILNIKWSLLTPIVIGHTLFATLLLLTLFSLKHKLHQQKWC